MDFETTEIICIAAAGLLFGLFGGSLGVGSGLMGLPFLTEVIGLDFAVSRMTCISNNIFISLSAVIKHRRKQRSFTGCGLLIITTIPGLFVGMYTLDKVANQKALWMIYCIFALAVLLLFLSKGKPLDLDDFVVSPIKFSIIGIIVGFFTITVGIGGGGIMVPLLNRWAKIPIKRAIVISSATIIATSVMAFVMAQNVTTMHVSMQGITISAIMLPGMLIGGYFGGELGQKLPNIVIKSVFCIIILIGLYKGIEKIIV